MNVNRGHFFVVEYTPFGVAKRWRGVRSGHKRITSTRAIPEASYRLVVDILSEKSLTRETRRMKTTPKKPMMTTTAARSTNYPATFGFLIGPGAAARPRGGVSDLWSP